MTTPATFWTPAKDLELRRRYKAGESDREMAVAIGARSHETIRHRRQKLRLIGRATKNLGAKVPTLSPTDERTTRAQIMKQDAQFVERMLAVGFARNVVTEPGTDRPTTFARPATLIEGGAWIDF